jgi:colanic acid/amylovoran biosynthesis glycosyltransferase
MSKILLLLTNAFPFSPSEPFIENEFPYLIKYFDQIKIIASRKRTTKIKYFIPENSTASCISINTSILFKLCSFRFYYSPAIKSEKNFLKQNNIILSWQKAKILLIEYGKAFKLYRHLSKITRSIEDKESIYVYSYWNDYKAIATALLKKRFPQIKAISRAHGWDVYFERNTSDYLPLKKFMADNLDAIFLVSQNGLKYMRNRLNDHPHLKLSYLGIINPKPNKSVNKTKILAVTSCSRLVPIKRVELIIDALSLINEDHIINWTHYGDGSEYGKLSDYASKTLGSKKNISYEMPGFIINTEIKEIYAKGTTNLLINTSSTEGLPVTIMEAMSFGIPVIGMDVGGVSEIIENKQNGLLLDMDAPPHEIAKAIEFFYDMNDDDYSVYSSNAYKTWNARFNAEINYPRFIEDVLKL